MLQPRSLSDHPTAIKKDKFRRISVFRRVFFNKKNGNKGMIRIM